MSAPYPPPPPWGPPAPWSPPPPRPARATGRWITGGLAVVVLLTGTFLPWVRSGRVTRNSYEVAGVSLRRLDVAPWLEAILQAWPFLGPVWAVVVVLAVLGRRRAAAGLALVLAVLTAVVAAGGVYLALRFDGAVLGGVLLGPAVTLAGALGVSTAAVLLARRRRPAPPAGPAPWMTAR